MKIFLYLIVGCVLFSGSPVVSFAGVNNWSTLGTTVPLSGGRIVCLATQPSGALMVGSLYDGAFRSDDNGITWKQISPASGVVSIILVHPLRAEEIYMGTLKGLLKTVDDGISWSTVLDQPIYSLAFDPVMPSTLYAGTSDGIFKSLDDGATWLKMSTGLETNDGVLPFIGCLIINRLNPQTLYLLASNSNRYQSSVFIDGSSNVPNTKNSRFGLFKTIDGAETWLRLANGLPNESEENSTQFNAPSTKSLAFAYTDTQVVYYTNGVGFYRSIDAGSTFEQLEEPSTDQSLLSRGVNEIISIPTDKPLLYGAGTFIGLFRTANRGIAWKPMNSGLSGLTYMPSIVTLSSTTQTELFAATTTRLWSFSLRSVDFTGDGKTDFEDFIFFANGFGKVSGEPEFNNVLDLDGNNRIDFSDFLTFVNGYVLEN